MENWEMEKAEKENDVEFLRNAMANLSKECCELKQENKLLKEESRQVAQENPYQHRHRSLGGQAGRG